MSPPDFAAVRDHVQVELVRFVRSLRRSGASVPANAATVGARALVEVGFDDRARVRTALRASLVTDFDDYETFDRLFDVFWRRLTAGLEPGASEPTPADGSDESLVQVGDAADPQADEKEEDDSSDARDGDRSVIEEYLTRSEGSVDEVDGDEVRKASYSPAGEAEPITVRPGEYHDDLEAAFRDLTTALAGLRGRRWESGDERIEARRALRTSFSTGGTVLSVPRRQRRISDVRAVLLVDVSRSVLDVLDRRLLVEFLHYARREWRDARVFFFDEDVREVSAAFDEPTARAAFDALEAAEAEWGGGTRIGKSMARLRQIAPDAVDRRTVTFVVSDGLERGDVATLERESSRVARRGKRLFWLNPLAASDTYEPTAEGMAAALPYLDGLFPFAGSADVTELARQLRTQGVGGSVGYEFDPRRETT